MLSALCDWSVAGGDGSCSSQGRPSPGCDHRHQQQPLPVLKASSCPCLICYGSVWRRCCRLRPLPLHLRASLASPLTAAGINVLRAERLCNESNPAMRHDHLGLFCMQTVEDPGLVLVLALARSSLTLSTHRQSGVQTHVKIWFIWCFADFTKQPELVPVATAVECEGT